MYTYRVKNVKRLQSNWLAFVFTVSHSDIYPVCIEHVTNLDENFQWHCTTILHCAIFIAKINGLNKKTRRRNEWTKIFVRFRCWFLNEADSTYPYTHFLLFSIWLVPYCQQHTYYTGLFHNFFLSQIQLGAAWNDVKWKVFLLLCDSYRCEWNWKKTHAQNPIVCVCVRTLKTTTIASW